MKLFNSFEFMVARVLDTGHRDNFNQYKNEQNR